MNNGKICISVCGDTAEAALSAIPGPDTAADIVEMRFDCLPAGEREKLLRELGSARRMPPILAAFRKTDQGGQRPLSGEERTAFWDQLPDGFWGCDLEEDALGFAKRDRVTIASFHDLEGVPDDLHDIFDRLSAASMTDVVKIAVSASEAVDGVEVWKLLVAAKRRGIQFIPVAMGEGGKWTRILGLAHGAFMTYGSTGEGFETAPGQIPARDLSNVFRVKELDEATDTYGIIAGDPSHSMSPFIHNPAFADSGLNAVFVPLKVTDLENFFARMMRSETREVELNLKGFAVTNPHKRAIVDHCDFLDETARAIGAVNTIKVLDGRIYGTNTDAEGFIAPLKEVIGDLSGLRTAVIGAGGAARACAFALRSNGADVTIVARDPEKAALVADDFGAEVGQLGEASFSEFDIVVNATPMGSRGRFENESPASADQLRGVKLVYDLTYNPRSTRLLEQAATAGCGVLGGLEMLISQAALQFEHWTGLEAPLQIMRDAIANRLGQ